MTPVRKVIDEPPSTATPPPPATPLNSPLERIRRRQFRRDDPRELRHLFSIGVAMLISRVVWLMPGGFRRWLADFGGMSFYRLFKSYRQNVRDNVRQVVGPDETDAAIDPIVRSIFTCAGRNFADVLVCPHLSPERVRRSAWLVEGDWSLVDAAMARGKGVIFFTGHLGAFDYLGHVLANRGYPIVSVTGRTTNRYVFDAVTYLRNSQGLGIVEATPSGIRRVIRTLRQGECIGFLGDYDYFQSGRAVEMFGRRTTLPSGPVRIARDTGAAIIPTFAGRTPDGYEISLGQPIYVEKTTNLDEDMERGLRQVIAALEPRIRGSLDQWVLFQAMWPEEAAAPAPAAPGANGHGDEPVPPPAA